MPTIKEILEKYLKKLDFLDLELILAEVIKKDRAFVIAHPEYSLRKTQLQKAAGHIKRRMKHEPLAYILGHKEFYGLDFRINRHTLIPRPETELLVEKVLEHIPKALTGKLAIVDVGTGSGNIILSIVKNIPEETNINIKFFATDISSDALRIARLNSKIQEFSRNITFVKTNLLSKLERYLSKNYFSEIIFVSNLPYLSKNIYRNTSPDIKRYEPRSALISENQGLAHYEKMFRQIKNMRDKSLQTKIFFFIEFSPEQKFALNRLVKKIFPRNKSSFHKDYSGRFRVMSGRL